MRILIVMLCLLAVPLSESVAQAQPSTIVPGDPQSYPHSLALPPLPFATYSPRPSLPPPQRNEAPESPNFAAGRVLSRPGFRAELLNDGRLVFDSEVLTFGITDNPAVGRGIGGVFDINDMMGGNDPYFSEKLRLLEETFELRAKQRKANNKRVVERALGDLPAYLDAVWNRSEWDPQTRRRLLFALWDECAEGGARNAREGARARQIIERFIAQNLPQESGLGYTTEEVRTLNAARMSDLEFAPQ